MASIPDATLARINPASAIARMPTGIKLLLILSCALLPFALIAVFATLQTTRTADMESAAQLRVASAESARALAIELIGDTTALRAALNALDDDAGNAPACARAQGIFAQQLASGVRFMIADRQGRVLCGDRFARDLATVPPGESGPVKARLIADRGVVLSMLGGSGRTNAAAFFPTPFLAEVARPSGFVRPYGGALIHGDERLTIVALDRDAAFERRETGQVGLGLDDLALEMSVRSLPLTSPVLIAMLLPLVMWAAAAGLSWFVVDRLLIRPLRSLRASVAAYVPGEIIDPGVTWEMPAQEIRELGDTFRAISRTVALHEAELAAGIVRQTRLTREVHHRVKNNLQVIASLINFHARSARGEEAAAAYASIQRRVDALAVVHRNHHAEMEENRGLSLRSMIGELASSIRATAPESSARMGIVLDVQPFLVSQDVAMAVSFLVTEIVELAMACDPEAKVRISAREGDDGDRAMLRVSSPALVETDAVRAAVEQRYGRVMQGLARQLRAPLSYEPLVGAYEVSILLAGRE